MRVPGVLQRLGLTYLAAAFVVRSFGVWTQGLIAIVLLVGHWAVLTLIPYGGHAGPVTRMHNLAGAIDARVFGLHTLMPGFDPEGLLGTATSVGSALTGAIAGQWLRKESDQRRRVLGLAGAGAMAVLLGVSWSMVWPVNKPLWSGSYVLVTSGLAALTLALCVYVIDDGRCRRWAQPFIWLGVNPLVIYFCSELVGHLIERPLLPRLLGSLAPKDWLYWQILSPLSGNVPGEWSSLLFATAFAAMWMGASAALHWNDVRIRV